MDRLTGISEITGLPIVLALKESCGESACVDVCEEYCEKLCVGCPVQEAITMLHTIEDTGLTPEEIKGLKAENARLRAELARATAKREELREFAVSAERDYMECDKMFLHVGRLRQNVGYNAYLVDAKQSRAIPLTFEQWMRGPQPKAGAET